MKKSKWTRGQIEMLLKKAADGSNRSKVFAEIAKETGRQADSVRNFYYKYIEGKKPAGHTKQRFVAFTEQQVTELLRAIVLGYSRGESVRGVCLRLADGDRTLMIRYQNKYRFVLKDEPARVNLMARTLEAQGYFVKNPVAKECVEHPRVDEPLAKVIRMPEAEHSRLSDVDINNLFMGLVRLVRKNAAEEQASGYKSQINALKAEIQRLKSKVKARIV